MARLAIRATSDSNKREHITTADARILLNVETDGKQVNTLGVYRTEYGALCITIDTHPHNITVTKDATGLNSIVYITA